MWASAGCVDGTEALNMLLEGGEGLRVAESMTAVVLVMAVLMMSVSTIANTMLLIFILIRVLVAILVARLRAIARCPRRKRRARVLCWVVRRKRRHTLVMGGSPLLHLLF